MLDDIDYADEFDDGSGGGLSVVDIAADGTIIEAYDDTTYNAGDGSVTVDEVVVTASSNGSCMVTDSSVADGVVAGALGYSFIVSPQELAAAAAIGNGALEGAEIGAEGAAPGVIVGALAGAVIGGIVYYADHQNGCPN